MKLKLQLKRQNWHNKSNNHRQHTCRLNSPIPLGDGCGTVDLLLVLIPSRSSNVDEYAIRIVHCTAPIISHHAERACQAKIAALQVAAPSVTYRNQNVYCTCQSNSKLAPQCVLQMAEFFSACIGTFCPRKNGFCVFFSVD